MSLKEHALTELEFLLSSEDKADVAMAKHILELIEAFYVEGFYFVDPDGDTYTTGASHAPVKFPFSPVQKKIKLNRLERFILNRFHRFHSVVVWYKGPFAEKVR